MKRRINLSKITTFALLLTVTAMILVAGTYAKYSSEASGTGATVIANWSFNVNGKNIAKEKFEFNLFETINDITTGEKDTNVADGLIAPGTTGSFEFRLDNTSDVTAEYTIGLEVSDASIPLEFSFDGDTWTKELDELSSTGVLKFSKMKNVTVFWRWAFDGVTDSSLGGKPVTVTANITATQLDNTNSALISNSKFTYGAYLSGGNKNTGGNFGLLKSTDNLYQVQDITIKVTDTDVSKYIVTLALYDESNTFLGLTMTNQPMTDGQITLTKEEMLRFQPNAAYFRVNIGIWSEGIYTRVPESANITVYKGLEAPDFGNSEESSIWKGKNIHVIGDSITVGIGVTNPSTEAYPILLKNMTGSNLTTDATSGIKLTTGMVPKVTSMTKPADLIIVFGGTNDYWHGGTDIGDIDSQDTNTFTGALNHISNFLKENYSESDYLFVFPSDQTYQNGSSNQDKGHGSLDDFRAAFIDVCEKNEVKYLDLGTITEFEAAAHTTDGVHPNAEGHAIIAEAIYNYIENNY